MPSCTTDLYQTLVNYYWHLSHFKESRLSGLSIRWWVKLSCKCEELWISNEMPHFHSNNTLLCLVYHFQTRKMWIYSSVGSLQPRAFTVPFWQHSICCVCPMKSRILCCLLCYWDSYKTLPRKSIGQKKKNHNIKPSCYDWHYRKMAIFIFKWPEILFTSTGGYKFKHTTE